MLKYCLKKKKEVICAKNYFFYVSFSRDSYNELEMVNFTKYSEKLKLHRFVPFDGIYENLDNKIRHKILYIYILERQNGTRYMSYSKISIYDQRGDSNAISFPKYRNGFYKHECRSILYKTYFCMLVIFYVLLDQISKINSDGLSLIVCLTFLKGLTE